MTHAVGDGITRRTAIGRSEPTVACPRCGTRTPVRLVSGPPGAKTLSCSHCRADVPI